MTKSKTCLIVFSSFLLIFAVGVSVIPFAFAQFAKSSGGGSAKAIEKLFSKNLKGGKCEVPPTWSGVIPSEKRFVPTFVDDAGIAHAYCDRQTGLVWDAKPIDENQLFSWGGALFHCINRTESWNGQMGGRLPSIPELASLVDTTSTLCGGGGPCLPDDHPFQMVQSATYWSASTLSGNTMRAWVVVFSIGIVDADDKDTDRKAWCVRGAMNADVY